MPTIEQIRAARALLGWSQSDLADRADLSQTGIALFDQDVFVNVVGGVRVTETGADTALVLAALSSFRNRSLPTDLITFGEIGLAGEIRPVPNGQERLREAAKHGFKHAIVPKANMPKKNETIEGLKVTPVQRVSELMETGY